MEDNYIKVYSGDMTSFNLQVNLKFATFYEKRVIIKGDKFELYVSKNELDTLKEICNQTKDVISNLEPENQRHYKRQISVLSIADIFNSVDC